MSERPPAERQRLAHFATHDDLTGLANRRHFSQRLHEACAQCARDGHQIAVVYLDLNGFKAINDTLGHEAGDRTLQLVARRLATTLRTQDLVARIGGDEFAIIINPCNARSEISELCLRLQAAISEPFTLSGTLLTVSASIGTSSSQSNAASTRFPKLAEGRAASFVSSVAPAITRRRSW